MTMTRLVAGRKPCRTGSATISGIIWDDPEARLRRLRGI
jgi:hypothetical protein